MNKPKHHAGGLTDDAGNDALLTESLRRLGDRATPPPWSTVVDRYEQRSRLAWLPSPRDRRLWAVAAGLVVLVAVGSALRLGPDLFDGEATDIKTINDPDVVPAPSDTTQPPSGDAGASHGDEALAIAQLLGADVLVATTGSTTTPAAQGYVVIDGKVDRHDTDFYRVVGVQGDALVTAGQGGSIADGPRYDLQGRPISCPPYAKFVEGTAAGPDEALAVDPVIQNDGGWALLIPGYEFGDPMDFGDPLGFDALGEEWWGVPLWEVDCDTGQRIQIPSTEGTRVPSLTGKEQATNDALRIERHGDTTLYFRFTEGERLVTVLDADGTVVLDTEMVSWQVSDDGSIIAAMDVDGRVTGYDAVTGEMLWTNSDVAAMVGAETFRVGERLVLAGRSEPMVAVVSISSGETLLTPTPFDNLFVRYAG